MRDFPLRTNAVSIWSCEKELCPGHTRVLAKSANFPAIVPQTGAVIDRCDQRVEFVVVKHCEGSDYLIQIGVHRAIVR